MSNGSRPLTIRRQAVPIGAPPLAPARGVTPLDPKFSYYIAPKRADTAAHFGALL